MSGFPNRTNRTQFGPELEDVAPVTDPKRYMPATAFELAWWATAGMCQTSPMAVINASVSGGAVTVSSQALSWDPNHALANITITYEATGRYSFAFASQYPDQRGSNVALSLRGGIAVPSNQAPYRGTHTGANNAPSLTDSAQSWTVNELVGKILHNLTDGSKTTVTSNTADTAVGVLAGGTDNDWDTNDEYVIIDPQTVGYVQMTSAYEGEFIFVDDADDLVDPSEFVVVLF